MDMFKPLNAHAQVGSIGMPTQMSQQSSFNFQPRRINFTQEERMRLLSLVEKHKSTIVDRCHDGSSTRRKADVWREIAEEFNAQTEDSCTRDMRQLRKCWENMKTRFRKLHPHCVDAPAAMLQEGEAMKSVLNDFGPTSLTPKMTNKINTLIFTEDEASTTSPFVDSILQKMSSTSTTSMLSSPQVSNDDRIVIRSRTFPSAGMSSTNSTVAAVEAATRNSAAEDFVVQREKVKHLSTSSDSGLHIQEIGAASPNNKPNNSGNMDFSRLNTLSTSSTSTSSGRIDGEAKRRLRQVFSDRLEKQPFVKRLRPHQQSGEARSTTTSKQTWSGSRRANGHLGSTMVDGERSLRMRYLRARIRDQEVRTRANIQRMRHANERHEATLLVLRRRAVHYEALTERLRGVLDSTEAGSMDVAGLDENEDFEEEDELMWEVLQ